MWDGGVGNQRSIPHQLFALLWAPRKSADVCKKSRAKGHWISPALQNRPRQTLGGLYWLWFRFVFCAGTLFVCCVGLETFEGRAGVRLNRQIISLCARPGSACCETSVGIRDTQYTTIRNEHDTLLLWRAYDGQGSPAKIHDGPALQRAGAVQQVMGNGPSLIFRHFIRDDVQALVDLWAKNKENIRLVYFFFCGHVKSKTHFVSQGQSLQVQMRIINRPALKKRWDYSNGSNVGEGYGDNRPLRRRKRENWRATADVASDASLPSPWAITLCPADWLRKKKEEKSKPKVIEYWIA